MKKIDWHSGFVDAMKLELLANEDDESMCEAINELFADETRAERERADRERKRAEKAEAEINELKVQLQEVLAENARLKATAHG